MLRIAGITKESIVDGLGIRQTIYLQGCKHNCEKCQNPETHDIYGGQLIDYRDLMEDIECDPLLDGITLSGGDPMEQALELIPFTIEIHKLGMNIWCYTGYTYEECFNDADRRSLLENCDVLVDGRFVWKLRTQEKRFVGSSNQRIIDIKKSLAAGKVIELELTE